MAQQQGSPMEEVSNEDIVTYREIQKYRNTEIQHAANALAKSLRKTLTP
jgi:demethoxyubiquinone hydroxylase (CLK1/Coq7/Cat5 family)